jgi:hypothetical protein
MNAVEKTDSKTASVWMHPTTASPACRYSYDPLRGKVKGQLAQGRPIHSDCGMWLTFFDKSLVIEPDGDLCPFCKRGMRVATPTLPVVKPKKSSNIPLHHLNHDA